MGQYLIGLDIGASKMQGAIANQKAKIMARRRMNTTGSSGFGIAQEVKSLITDLLDDIDAKSSNISGIGIGVAGMIDHASGTVVFSPNMPLRDFPLRAAIEDTFSVPTAIDNDANVAVLGEKHFGLGVGYKNIIALTLGTGIGSGIIIDGRLMRGATGSAAEIGHMVIDAKTRDCSCGNKGCLEALVSGWALERMVGELIEAGGGRAILKQAQGEAQKVTAECIAMAAAERDREALEIFTTMGDNLGVGLVNIVNIFNPEIIIILGGMIDSKEFFLDRAIAHVRDYALIPNSNVVKIVPTQLGSDAPLLGAIALVTEQT